MKLSELTTVAGPLATEAQELDPEWTVWRRYSCGHVQHACCITHMDTGCPLCETRHRVAGEVR